MTVTVMVTTSHDAKRNMKDSKIIILYNIVTIYINLI